MAEDWQVDDLALCVSGSCDMFVGYVGTVRKIVIGPARAPANFRGRVFLSFEDRPKHAYERSLFTKIQPLTDEEHREAILELANDTKITERA